MLDSKEEFVVTREALISCDRSRGSIPLILRTAQGDDAVMTIANENRAERPPICSTSMNPLKCEDVENAVKHSVRSSELIANVAHDGMIPDTILRTTVDASVCAPVEPDSAPPATAHSTTVVSSDVSKEGLGNGATGQECISYSRRASVQMRAIWDELKRERLERAATRSTNSPTVWYTKSYGGPVVVTREGATGRAVEPPSPISWDRGRVNTDVKFDMTIKRERSRTNISVVRKPTLFGILPGIGNMIPQSPRTTFLSSTGLFSFRGNDKNDSENSSESGVPHRPAGSFIASRIGGRGLQVLKILGTEGGRSTFRKTC